MPWPYWNVFGFKFPTAGGPILRYFGPRYILKGIKQSLKRGDTIFYFHTWDIHSETFPIGASITSRRPFYWYGKGIQAEKSLRFILDDLSEQNIFTTCKNIRDKWPSI